MTKSEKERARFWDQLLEVVAEGRVIPVVGRELLTSCRNGDQVSYHQLLAERLAEYLDVDASDLPPGDPLNTVAYRFLEGPDRPDLQEVYSGLKQVTRDLGELPLPESLLRLARIDTFKLFVTTTFDTLLERALNETRFGGKPRTQVVAYSTNSPTDLPSEIAALPGPTIFHLLGRISAAPDYAVTEEDTLEFVHALQSEDRRPKVLFGELSRHQVLILGCRYPNWLARFFLRATAGARLPQAQGTTYVVDSAVLEDREQIEFFKHFGGRTRLFYWGSAAEFTEELERLWQEQRPDATAPVEAGSGAPMIRGAVFISYASEDRQAAERIKADLDRAGIDVWLDTRALQAGDDYGEKIRQNIHSCSVFLPLISRNTSTPNRRYFRLEWAHAEEVAKMAPSLERFIVPLAIDDTAPGGKYIPEGFRKLHWQRLDEGRCTPEFVQTVKEIFRDYHKNKKQVAV